MLRQMLSRIAFLCEGKLHSFRVIPSPTVLRMLSAKAAQEPPIKAVVVENEEDQAEEQIDYEKQLEALMPSENVWKAAPFKHHKKLKDIINELEIYAYMGTYIPKYLSDDDWFRLLNTTESVGERVSFLEYVAIKQRRQEKDKKKKSDKQERFLAELQKEKEKFERGEMGYGPDLYQLIHNPMRNRKKIQAAQGARIVSALRCNERPKIAFDLQYMFNEKHRIQSELGNQMQYVISENLDSRTPWHMSFVNFPNTEDSQKWLEKSVGFYGGLYTHQTVLPDFTEKGVKETFPDEEVVYISRHARETLDGPLNVGAIALCVSMDTAREALGAARRGRIRAVRLPIKKYVKWQQGPMYLPFPNIMRIFRHVHRSGGDWETALLNNISKRHLMTPEEKEQEAQQEKMNRRKIRQRERNELIRTICEATGHH
ncbi:hypothetical protein Aduo_007670 [Ancylostoma duodenale]